MELINNYLNSLQAIYDHVGFTEDWVVYPIEDSTNYFWSIIDDNDVKFAETMEKFNSDGDYYIDELYKQRFYSKWIYEGEDFTLVFCNPGVDGMKWFRIFDNKKRVRDDS